MEALARIALENRNGAELDDELKFQKLLHTFEFVLTLVLLTKVLSSINAASVHLQARDTDLLKAAHHFKTSIDAVSDYRNNVTDEATRICCLWGVEC